MKIVKLKGGLGNQMFQYAFAKLIESRTNDEVKLDFSAYNRLGDDVIRVPRIGKFNLSLQSATKQEIESICKFKHYGNSLSLRYKIGIYAEKTLNRKYFFESDRSFIDPAILIDNLYFDGYWQSYKYTDEVGDIIRKEFVPNYELSSKTAKFIDKVHKENSVFVGVRKGDYASSKKAIQHYGNFEQEYYLGAMEIISSRVDNPVFYIFSNDVAWCKQNLNWGEYNVVYREIEDQVDDFEELMIMSSCKHAIIVNSTYNWWGANLIKNPNKIVVAPKRWFFDNASIDIVPENWIKREN